MKEESICPMCSRKEHNKKMGKMNSPGKFMDVVKDIASVASPAYMLTNALVGGANKIAQGGGDDNDKGFMDNPVIGNSASPIKLKSNSGKGCKRSKK